VDSKLDYSVLCSWASCLGIVHTTLEKFENKALFLRSGLLSTLIRHEHGAFRRRSSNQRNLKTPAFRFLVDGKHFVNNGVKIIIWFIYVIDNKTHYIVTKKILLNIYSVVCVTIKIRWYKWRLISITGKHVIYMYKSALYDTDSVGYLSQHS